MFTRLRIKNIKAWGNQLWEQGIELAPVTLLLGANSAGKTSILQVPLLLSQTFGSTDRSLDLNLGGQKGDLLDFGSYEDVIHGHDAKLEMGFGLSIENGDSASGGVRSFDYEATYVQAAKIPSIERFRLTANDETYGADRQARGGYRLVAPDYSPSIVGGRGVARRVFRPERSLTLPAEALAELGAAGSRIQDLSLDVKRAIERVAYLGPLRESPERSYLWGRQTPGSLGPRGQRAVHALLASANSRKKRKPGEEGGRGWLVERVSEWLKRLGVADGLELERQGRSRYFEVMLNTRGQRANIVDVGFGISQVLPMIVLAHFVPRGSVIITEQPEIHLHPRAQVGLAELMVEVARDRNVQFIVETHSEHIFRRLQFLIADEKIAPTDCRMYFVDRDKKGAAELRPLEADAFGRISHWPDHFFGDAIGETERQMRAMVKRMQTQREDGSRD
ncbi:MAG: DUF3696 domain-containing protein [Deltaproteobacteria bacterium]|nr:DUF3696 domain-containing protein [Deltaproteobacteria bacterium]